MKKFISIASVLGLLLANSVSADIISPGPFRQIEYIMVGHGVPILAKIIAVSILLILVFAIFFLFRYIIKKWQEKIKEKKNKNNIIVK